MYSVYNQKVEVVPKWKKSLFFFSSLFFFFGGVALYLPSNYYTWGLLSVLLGILFCCYHHIWGACLLLLCLLSIFLFDQWLIREAMAIMQKQVHSQAPIWVRGKIINQNFENERWQLHLTQVEILQQNNKWKLAEIHVDLASTKTPKFSRWYQKQIQIGGILQHVKWQNGIRVTFGKRKYQHTPPPLYGWVYQWKIWQTHLAKRAEFYLSEEASAIFLPVLLGVKKYHPQVTPFFRNTGMSHVLVISGLHIGLLFVVLWWTTRMLLKRVPKLLLMTQFLWWIPLGSILLIWGYLLLIGMPIPAKRATIVLSFWYLLFCFGQKYSPLSILFVIYFSFLFWETTIVYNLSFQLSLTAVFWILWCRPWYWQSVSNSWQHRFLKYLYNSLIVTFAVLMGIFPILLHSFQKVPLDSFWLNTIMVPILACMILPLGIILVAISAVSVWSSPHLLEKIGYEAMELVLQFWLSGLHLSQEYLSIPPIEIATHWLPIHYVLYYGIVLFLSSASFLLISKIKNHSSSLV